MPPPDPPQHDPDAVPLGMPDPEYSGPERRKLDDSKTAQHAALGAAAGMAAGQAAGQMGIQGRLWQNVIQTTFAVVVVVMFVTNMWNSHHDEETRVNREVARDAERQARDNERELRQNRRDDLREQYMREDLREQRTQQRVDLLETQKRIDANTAAILQVANEMKAIRTGKNDN